MQVRQNGLTCGGDVPWRRVQGRGGAAGEFHESAYVGTASQGRCGSCPWVGGITTSGEVPGGTASPGRKARPGALHRKDDAEGAPGLEHGQDVGEGDGGGEGAGGGATEVGEEGAGAERLAEVPREGADVRPLAAADAHHRRWQFQPRHVRDVDSR